MVWIIKIEFTRSKKLQDPTGGLSEPGQGPSSMNMVFALHDGWEATHFTANRYFFFNVKLQDVTRHYCSPFRIVFFLKCFHIYPTISIGDTRPCSGRLEESRLWQTTTENTEGKTGFRYDCLLANAKLLCQTSELREPCITSRNPRLLWGGGYCLLGCRSVVLERSLYF